MMTEVITEHNSLEECNTFLSNNWENSARIVTVYVSGLGAVKYVTKHFI